MLSWLWICLPSEYTPKGVQYLLVYRVSVTASILKKDLKRVLAETRGVISGSNPCVLWARGLLFL